MRWRCRPKRVPIRKLRLHSWYYLRRNSNLYDILFFREPHCIPRCYQQFFWYWYFAGIRFAGFSVFWSDRSPLFLLPPFPPPFFPKGGWSSSKRGPLPPFWGKRGALPPFWHRNVTTEFSFGMVLVIPDKYQRNTDQKYQDNMSYSFYCEYYRKIK